MNNILRYSIFMLTILLTIPCYAEDKKRNAPLQEIPSESYLINQLDELRQVHEGAVYILKRYATMEALITAVDRGRDENTAFGIGVSSLVPGVGQMINQDYLQGSLLIFASSFSWSTVSQLEFTRKRQTSNQELLPIYYSAIFIRNGIMTYSMLHALNENYRDHKDRTQAMWIGTASLVPGVGQAINGDWWGAGGFFAAWSAATVLTYYLEEALFIDGDESYLVKKNENYSIDVAYLPGGAGIFVNLAW